nr:hypothetical protein [Tanacetum cinerariifolium]
MGTLRESLTERTEGALHLGPEQPRVYSDLTSEEKERYNANIRVTNIILQGLLKDMYSLINHYTDAKDIWDNVKMLMEGLKLIKEDHISQLRNIKMTMSRMQLNLKFVNNMLPEWGFSPSDNLIENLTNTLSLLTQSYKTYLPQTNNQLRTLSNPKNQATIQDDKVVIQNVQGRQNRGQGNNAQGATGYEGAKNKVGFANPGQARQIKCYNYNNIDNVVNNDVDEQPIQDLAHNMDNVFQADDCDAFDSDVDEASTAQTMFMVNLSYADHVYDEAGPSYDSDVLSEVHDPDHYLDAVCEHHEVHEMHDDVQPNYVVDSHTGYTSDSNMISYDHYVKDNAVQVVQSDVSVVPNDAYMVILNDMHESPAQHVYVTTQTK